MKASKKEHIRVLTEAFATVCTKEECLSIINAKEILCGKKLMSLVDFEDTSGENCPERIIAKNRGVDDVHEWWKLYDELCDATDLMSKRSPKGVPYIDALEQSTEADVRKAARLALKKKS